MQGIAQNNNLNIMENMDNPDYLNILSGKLRAANKTLILEKKRQREQIQQRLDNIQNILHSKKKFQSDAIEKAKFSVDKISSLSNQTVKNFNLKSRKQEELINNLKQKIENDLDQSQRDHQDSIEAIIERGTEKVTLAIDQLSKKAKDNSESNEKSLQDLSRAINNLQKKLQNQIQERKDNCQQIQSDISNEVTKFNLLIQKQRERREASDKKVQAMIKEIQGKIETEVETQTSKRKKNNASLLKLIQVACQRLEQKLQIDV